MANRRIEMYQYLGIHGTVYQLFNDPNGWMGWDGVGRANYLKVLMNKRENTLI
jgi:hypothetical protein